jgi:hypothetical protein
VQGFDNEPVDAQHADPVAVAEMELDPAARPLEPAQPSLRPQELLLGEAPGLWHAQGGQDTVGQEHQPAAGAVPAMAAVRAMPRSSPGMILLC